MQALGRIFTEAFLEEVPFKLRLGGCRGIRCEKCRKAFQAWKQPVQKPRGRERLVSLGIGSDNSSHHSVDAYRVLSSACALAPSFSRQPQVFAFRRRTLRQTLRLRKVKYQCLPASDWSCWEVELR